MGCLNASFTLVVELVESKHRRLASMGLMIAFPLGEALVGIFAIFILDWRSFHFITSIPLFLMIPIYWLLAESPRWLNRKGRYKELFDLFKVMAKMNRSKIPSDVEKQLQTIIRAQEEYSKSNPNEVDFVPDTDVDNEKNAKVEPKILLCDPTLRMYTLVMCSNWALVTLGKCLHYQQQGKMQIQYYER